MISFINVGSGSKGNATIIYNEDTLIQIDMGLAKKNIVEALNLIDRKLEDIKAIFITHDHADHVSTLNRLPPSIDRYAAEGTLEKDYRIINTSECVKIGSFVIQPLKTSHDAINPVGFLIKDDDESLVYVTDTGYLPDETLSFLVNATYYIFESNHDLEMLRLSNRPLSLKRRIRGKKGHLSNSLSASYLSFLVGDMTKEIYLAHLSEECNKPSIALSAHEKYIKKHKSIKIKCLKQREMTRGGHQ